MASLPKSQIIEAVERAMAAYDWQTVFELVAEGLEQPGLTASKEYDLRAARMLPNWFVGDLDARFADAEIMLAIAGQTSDTPRLINALHEHHWTHHLLGEYRKAHEIIEEAYALVTPLEDAALEARTLNFLGSSVKILGDTEAARSYHQAALELSRNGVSPYDESWALHFLALLPPVNADPARVDAFLQEAVTVARDARILMQEMFCLSTIGIRSRDFVRKRYYLGLTRDIAEEIDMPTMLANVENSLGFLYWQLGLFGQAARHAAEAVRLQRQFGFTRDMMFSLDSLGFIALDVGDRQMAKSSFDEILDLAQDEDMQLHRQGALAGLGRLAFSEGHLTDAESYLREATEAYEKAGRPGDQAAALAGLALVHLEQGDTQRALEVSTRAMALAAENAFVVFDSPVGQH